MLFIVQSKSIGWKKRFRTPKRSDRLNPEERENRKMLLNAAIMFYAVWVCFVCWTLDDIFNKKKL